MDIITEPDLSPIMIFLLVSFFFLFPANAVTFFDGTSDKQITIVYWSDFACPFCYIGEKRMEHVLEELSLTDQAEFIFKSFELDPNAPPKRSKSIEHHFAEKYHLTLADARQRVSYISSLGQQEGIDFRYATVQAGNTFDAHRVTKMIQNLGNNTATDKLIQLFYDAYFTKNLCLSDRSVLAEIAEQVGINKEEVKKMLSGQQFAEEVREDEMEAHKLHITGVPYFILNNKYTLSGADSKENMKRTILKASRLSKASKTQIPF